jgi:hydrogenase-4 component E
MFLATRQVTASMNMFIRQAILLSLSALLQAYVFHSPELLLVAALTVVSKAVIVPWVLKRTLGDGALTSRREVDLAVSVPGSLIIALGISLLAYVEAQPLVGSGLSFVSINLPVGLAVLLISVYALSVRREALPQFIALLMLDNGAFFAGVAIATSSPLWELVAALEAVVVAVIVILLTKTISERMGTTAVSCLAGLREEGIR